MWVRDDVQAWVPATIVDEEGDKVKVELGGNARTLRTMKRGELGPLISREESLHVHLDDMVKMEDVNEATILHNVRMRFKEDLIYTNIGTILVSVNPFKWMTELYASHMVDRFQQVTPGELTPPHIYAVANAAMMGIRDEQEDQSIIISGESGAGKTEATKKCLQFFAEVTSKNAKEASAAAGAAAAGAGASGGGAKTGIEQRLLAANPLLEGFGNAKTVRNNNSSRFGKWMVVHFDDRVRISMCHIENYLLEKSRVVFQARGERNYHIFYMMNVVPDADLKRTLGTSSAADFHFCSQGGCNVVEGMDDAKEFKELLESADALGLPKEEVQQLFRVAAAVLHMGNLQFESSDGDPQSPAALVRSPSVKKALAEASRLLGVPEETLASVFLHRLLVVNGKATEAPLKMHEAAAARNTFAKTLYDRQFDWIVKRINTSMAGDVTRTKTKIGVLDIFGFEIFEHNSFEQLCINYCNEMLQQHFNYNVFKAEQETYRSEGIDASEVKYIDNQDVLDLIEKKADPAGVLHIIQQEILSRRGTDKGFLTKMNATHKANPRYVISDVRKKDMGEMDFGVRHYAGTVVYDSTSFIEKNEDTMMTNLKNLGMASTLPFVSKVLFKREQAEAADPNSSRKRPTTVGKAFADSLKKLNIEMNKTRPHYVRCIKPNAVKKPDIFDAKLCLQQLQYAGVFEAVKIRQQGFPFRWTHDIFYSRYRGCATDRSFRNKYSAKENFKAKCTALLKDLTAQAPVLGKCQVGKTMVLYRAEPHRILEMMRDMTRDAAVRVLQRTVRGFFGRKRFLRLVVVRVMIKKAIEERSLEALQKAIKQGEEEWFQIPDLAPARVMCERLAAEKEALDALKTLLAKDPLEAYAEFDGALKKAKGLGLRGHPTYVQADNKFKTVREMAETKGRLTKGLDLGDKGMIMAALAKADELKAQWGDFIKPEDRARVESVLKVIAAEEATLSAVVAALSSGAIAGSVGSVDVSSVSTGELDLALAKANQTEIRTAAGKHLLESAKCVRRMRQGFVATAAADSDGNWAATEAAVNECVHLHKAETFAPAALDELRLAAAEVRDRRVARRLAKAMRVGAAAGSVGSLAMESVEFGHLQTHVTEFEEHKKLTSGSAAGAGAAALPLADEEDEDSPESRDLLNGPAARKAPYSAKVQRLYDSVALLLKLRKAMKKKDWSGIRRACTEAQAQGVTPEAQPEFDMAQDEHNNHTIVFGLSDALKAGMAEGAVGDLDTDVIETDKLAGQIEVATSLGPKTGQAKALLAVAGVILEVRRTMQDHDWDELGDIVKRAATVDKAHIPEVTQRELQVARWESENVEIVDSLNEALAEGAASGAVGEVDLAAVDLRGLKDALTKVDRLGCRTKEASWLREVATAVLDLRAAFRGQAWSELQSHILKVRSLDRSRGTGGAKEEFAKGKDVSATSGRRLSKRMSLAPGTLTMQALQGGMAGARGSINMKSRRQSAVFGAGGMMGGGGARPAPAAGAGRAGPGTALGTSIDIAEKVYKLPPPTVGELRVLQLELDNHEIISSTTDALQEGQPSGPVGGMSTAGLDIQGLSDVVDAAENRGPKTATAKCLVASANLVLKLRRAAAKGDWRDITVNLLPKLHNPYAEAARASILGDGSASGVVEVDPATGKVKARPAVKTGFTEDGRIILHEAASIECERYQLEANYLQVLDELSDALRVGAASGQVGSLDMTTVDVRGLAKAMDTAKQLGTFTERLRHLQALARLIWQMRSALLDADWVGVESLLEASRDLLGIRKPLPPGCEVLDETLNEVALMRAEVDNRKVIGILKRALLEGRPDGDIGHLNLASISVEPLEDALEVALRLGAKTPEAKCLVSTCIHIRAMRIALMGGQWDRLGSLILYANAVIQRVAPPPAAGASATPGVSPVQDGVMGTWSVAEEHVDALAAAADASGSAVSRAQLRFDLWYDGIAADAVPEVEVMHAEQKNRNVIVYLTEALRTGAASGTVGALDASTVDVSTLDWTINFAQKVGCATVEAQQMVVTAQLVRRVRHALLDRNWQHLEQVLTEAHGKVLADIVAPEVRLAQDELDNRAILTELTSALARGKPQGQTGRLYVGSIETQPLADAIALAGRLGCKTEDARQMLFTAKVVARLRHCLLSGDYNEAALTLDAVRGKKLATVAIAEVRAVQDEVDNWVVMTGLTAAMKTGTVQGDIGALSTDGILTEALTRELERAREIGVKTPDAQRLVASGQQLLALRHGVMAGDWERVREVVEECADMELADIAVAEIQLLHDELNDRQITSMLTTALTTGGPKGKVGDLSLDAVEVALLDAAIAAAVDTGVKTEAAAKLLTSAKIVRRLRSVLLSGNWEWVGSVLSDAREVKEDFPLVSLRELQLVQDELDNRSILSALTAALSAGGPSGTVGDLALAGVDTAGLDAAINYAKTLGCKTIEASQMVATAQLVRRLRQSLVAGDLALASEMLDGVKGKVLAAAAADEMQLIKYEVDNWMVISGLTDAVATGAASGSLARIDVSTVDVSALDDAIALTMKLGCHTPDARRCLLTALLVRRLRASLTEGDWPFLRQVLAEAEAEEDSIIAAAKPEVHRARDELEVRDTLQELQSATEAQDEDALASALAHASKFSLSTHPDKDIVATVEAASSALGRVQRAKAALRAAIKAMSAAALVDSIAGAASLGLTGSLVDEARATLETVESLTRRASGALRAMDKPGMQQALAACQKVGLSIPVLDEIRTSLALPEAEFMRRELAAAVAMEDGDRIITLTMRLKDMFFKEEEAAAAREGRSSSFALRDFPHLKPVALFAKRHGVADTSLAEAMLSHQADPIHTSLTSIDDPAVRRLAVKMFRNALAFMGDKQMSKPLVLAQETVEMAITYPELRDEALIQVTKQLTSNPDPASEARGWVLMELCLSSFPPSEELENFIEAELRQRQALRAIRVLHTTLYRGPRSLPPSLEEISQALEEAGAPPLPAYTPSSAGKPSPARSTSARLPSPSPASPPKPAGAAAASAPSPTARPGAPVERKPAAPAGAGPVFSPVTTGPGPRPGGPRPARPAPAGGSRLSGLTSSLGDY